MAVKPAFEAVEVLVDASASSIESDIRSESRASVLSSSSSSSLGSVESTPDACGDSNVPCMVKDGLYIGSSGSEANLALLLAFDISHVLQVGQELKPSHPGAICYRHISMCDTTNDDIVSCFRRAFEFIEQARKTGCNVLVHCSQGVSRSTAVVAGYLMWKDRLSFDDALSQVRAARPLADPNSGFLLQLEEFERSGCDLDSWKGWSEQQAEDSLRHHIGSAPKSAVELIRSFHSHLLGDDTFISDRDLC